MSEQAKHTPGPWKLAGGRGKKGDLYVWQSGNYFGGHGIATVHGEHAQGDTYANARLIAAAPELLAALKQIIADHEERVNLYHREDQHPHRVLVMNLGRAAIIKATGN